MKRANDLFKKYFILMFLSASLALIFSYLFMGKEIKSSLVSATVAIFMPPAINILDKFLFKLRIFNKLSLIVGVLVKTATVVIFLTTIIILTIYIFYGHLAFKSIISDSRLFLGLAFGLVMFMIFSFIEELHRIIGRKTFFDFLTGSYLRPRKVNRVFLFLDIVGSTTIAEKLTNEKFHLFINDFICDITAILDKNNAEIYKYVGDEVIAVWNIDKKLKHENILNSIVEIENKISQISHNYQKKFNLVPEYRIGIHCGEVIAGEMGNIKKELVYLGDVVNTTSRLVSIAGQLNEKCIFSDQAIALIRCKNDPRFFKHNAVSLKGKTNTLDIYAFRTL